MSSFGFPSFRDPRLTCEVHDFCIRSPDVYCIVLIAQYVHYQ